MWLHSISGILIKFSSRRSLFILCVQFSLVFMNIIQQTLVQKSYCFTPGVGDCISVHMLNVRVNVKDLEFQSVCIFSWILIFCILLIKPLTTNAHSIHASSYCTWGNSGEWILNLNHHKTTKLMVFISYKNVSVTCFCYDIVLFVHGMQFKCSIQISHTALLP